MIFAFLRGNQSASGGAEASAGTFYVLCLRRCGMAVRTIRDLGSRLQHVGRGPGENPRWGNAPHGETPPNSTEGNCHE